MPTFRQRPLTWLFLIATACLDLVVLADRELPWVCSLTLGQVMVAGGWFALGNMHRLARAAIFVAVILVLASPDYFYGNSAGEWNYVLGTFAALGAATAAASFVWSGLGRLLSPRGQSAAMPFRFPVVEILGWMIVVAVACAALRRAEFSSQVLPLGIFSLAVATGLLMTWFRPSIRVISPWDFAIGIITVVLLFSILPHYIPNSTAQSDWGVFVFVGLWILVQRLDKQLPSVPAVAPGESAKQELVAGVNQD